MPYQKTMSLVSLLTSVQIRARPVLLLGDTSLKTLSDFIYGYASAHAHLAGKRCKKPAFPKDFHDWVAYRLRYGESTSGWRRMITDRFRDDGRALAEFFRLYDEYAARKKRHVATIVDCAAQVYRITPAGERKVSIPKRIRIFTYSDGSGCFTEPNVVGNYFKDIQCLVDRHGTTLGDLEIVDRKEVKRLRSFVGIP